MPNDKNLDQVEMGGEAVIESVAGPRAFVRRLLSLGVAPGISLKVVRRAPLGDPLQVQIGKLNLSIRRNEARNVLIR